MVDARRKQRAQPGHYLTCDEEQRVTATMCAAHDAKHVAILGYQERRKTYSGAALAGTLNVVGWQLTSVVASRPRAWRPIPIVVMTGVRRGKGISEYRPRMRRGLLDFRRRPMLMVIERLRL